MEVKTVEANIILVKCLKAKKTFGMRVQKMNDGDWWRTWAFKIKESNAQSEGYDKNKVVGNLYSTEEYPGCPHCGTHGFVQCHKCKKLTCWDGETSLKCQWCGETLENIVTATEKFDVSGDKF